MQSSGFLYAGIRKHADCKEKGCEAVDRVNKKAENVKLSDDGTKVIILDQEKLPNVEEYLELDNAEDIYEAIFRLKVRGAPAIGICAGYGIYVLARQIDTEDFDTFYREFKEKKDYLDSSRPTAVNLSWALNRMERVVLNNREKTVAEIKDLLLAESRKIQAEDVEMCRAISEHGLSLLKDGDGILTHVTRARLPHRNMGPHSVLCSSGKKEGWSSMCSRMRRDPFSRGQG